MKILIDLILSWANTKDAVHETKDLFAWLETLNSSTNVSIEKTSLSKSNFWFYENELGIIRNKDNSFFSIRGIKQGDNEQPIIVQDEIGYLGIICKEINGLLHFLMQAKIEPGNLNKVQISPTIQATKSNFMQRHGGKKPAYIDYFINSSRYMVIVDQIQSEQSSRFYKKRNRNIIIKIDEEIEVLDTHRWMTLGQIKKLMRHDNIINMDTRTVISCIPFSFYQLDELQRSRVEAYFNNKELFNSIFPCKNESSIVQIYSYINNYKMFNYLPTSFIPLRQLKGWTMDDNGIYYNSNNGFEVIYCDIQIEGREVVQWMQPLIKARNIATFGLFICIKNEAMNFLVKATAEIGCFDTIELGPTMQTKDMQSSSVEDSIGNLFMQKYKNREGILNEVFLSEEGGRFYHEQNLNIIIKLNDDELLELPDGYFWLDYKSLNQLVQVNNCLNIQLRNLLSLLEV